MKRFWICTIVLLVLLTGCKRQKPFFNAISEALRHGYYRPSILGWSAVDKYVNLAFKDIVMDGQDVKETLDRYARELQEELER